MTALKTYTSNAAETTVTALLAVGATTVNVVSTTGFPSVPFYAVLEPSVDAKREVVLATAKTATTLTLTRAQDGTTDVAHNSGVAIKVVPVAAHITDLHDRIDLIPPTPTLATVATTGAYADLTGKPTLGTAADNAETDFATAAQGGKADSALQPAVIGTTVQAYNANNIAGNGTILQVVSLSQAAYDALATKVATTLYVITS